MKELSRAVREAIPGTTVLVEDGDYALTGTLELATPDLVLASRSGHRNKVVLHGAGMDDTRVRVAIAIGASRVTVANLTIRDVSSHGVQVRGEAGASQAILWGLHIIDTGQQLVKGSSGSGPLYADDGLVACSVLEYTDHAPSSYTNGIDVLAARGWVVRDNVLLRIRGPKSEGWAAGPAVLFWASAIGTRVERNTIRDCYRGIAFGLGPKYNSLARNGEAVYDHQGGRIARNILVNENEWADEGIEVNAAHDVAIEDNLVDVAGRVPWSISLRFPMTTAVVRRNRTLRQITLRNDARGRLEENETLLPKKR